MKSITALRGMPDRIPPETSKISILENILKQVASQYAYDEIRTPILESIEVFQKLGDESDIIGKEMYTFKDQ